MMGTGDMKILEEKPNLEELCEHIKVYKKWYPLGILLKLNPNELNIIEYNQDNYDVKVAKMFELWLATSPHATRRQVIDALRKEVIGENTTAYNYMKTLLSSCISDGKRNQECEITAFIWIV